MTAKRMGGALMALVLVCGGVAVAADGSREYLEWTQLPELPPAKGRTRQIGLAGPFVGVHGGALIVAGGANFPIGHPWEKLDDGSSPLKVYHGSVYVLQKATVEQGNGGEGEDLVWVRPDLQLTRPWSYGASVSTPDGLICIGGEYKETKDRRTAQHYSADSFVLRWDPRTGQLLLTDRLAGTHEDPDSIAPLPPLPEPCYGMAGVSIKNVVYVCGGATSSGATLNFWKLDLGAKTDAETFRWEKLAPWPGPPRLFPIAVVQSDGTDDCLYLFSGRNVQSGEPTEILTDAYKYSPNSATWKRIADIAPASEPPRCVMAGTGIASGANHILLFGGADGRLFLELEKLDREILTATAAEAISLTKRKVEILENHPGFSRDVLAYSTITDTWTKAGEMPTGSHVTTVAVKWDDGFVIPTGEVRPGVRSPAVWKASRAKAPPFGAFNYTVLGVYLVVLIGMGLHFSKHMKSTDDFFKAGRRIPWWAAGLSIFGTQLSAITFMTIPAKAFATDWRYFWGNMAIVAIAPFIVFLFLPFYRRLDVTTAYEYLEMRFNLAVRLLGSVMFMLAQFGRIGIVLYLPSIALSVVTGMDIQLCIVLMGVLCILYTVLGGMEAVVWTDVLQVIVLAGGALLCLVLIPFHVPGGWNGMMDVADQSGRLRLLDLRWSLADATFFVIFVGGFGMNIVSYGTDQTVIQRYLTTKSEKAAAQSIWTNAVLTIPATFLFFTIGTALFGFFKTHPATMDPTLAPADALFPYYIVSQLPAGVAGLVIAAVFAAAMSSLDSSMNSVSAAFTTDFFRRLGRGPSERSCLVLARWATVLIGALGMGFALWMAAQPDIRSLWDVFSKYLGMFGGGLAGLFLLAMFTRRAHSIGALTGLAASAVVQVAIEMGYTVHPWFRAMAGIAACFAVGYLASVLTPLAGKKVEGLTIYTLGDKLESSEV